MSKFDLFETLPEGFRLATEEDMPLVTLTLAQSFADYRYPIPSVDMADSAWLRFYYEVGERCARNAMEKGVVLTNEDFSAVLEVTDFEDRADYGVDSLYENLKKNADIAAAENMLQITDYICKGEETLVLNEGTLFIDQLAVQTPRQGQKLASKLMRQLFDACDKKGRDVLLYTNTARNRDIYNHFGYETIQTISREDLNSDTYYLLRRAVKS